MANTTVQIQMPSGLSSPTLTLYADGSDTAGNTPDTLTEPTNRKGLYQATVTEALDGMHFAKVLVGSNVVATGWVVLADDTNTYNVVNDYADESDLTQQNIADALKLAPTAGSPAAGSVNADLDTLLARTGAGVTVTTSGAADSRGNINTPIKRGDSYGPSSGNAFVVNGSSFSSGVWGGGGVTATLKLKQGTTYKTTGTVAVSHDGDETITATISFTTAETTALVEDTGTTYEIEFTVGSEQRTIEGKWSVIGSDE